MVKKITIGLIKVYQITLSPVLHWLSFSFFGTQSGCRFYPSCSQYAIDSFSRNTFREAFVLVFKRLRRCHPYSL